MQITIDSTNVELDDALREYIELRASFALTRYSQQIKRIVLHVENAIRPVGGVDVCCDVSVKLISDEEVEIEVQDSQIRTAVAHAVDRAGYTVERKLQERRESGSSDK